MSKNSDSQGFRTLVNREYEVLGFFFGRDTLNIPKKNWFMFTNHNSGAGRPYLSKKWNGDLEKSAYPVRADSDPERTTDR